MLPTRSSRSTAIRVSEWKSEIESQKEFFDKMGPTMPKALLLARELQLASLEASTVTPTK